jgi:hypothetical protein
MMNQLKDTVYTAYVGIDWADAKHDICVRAAGSEERAFDRMVHKPERIEAWARAMVQRFARYLERQGFLVRDAQLSWSAPRTLDQ